MGPLEVYKPQVPWGQSCVPRKVLAGERCAIGLVSSEWSGWGGTRELVGRYSLDEGCSIYF